MGFGDLLKKGLNSVGKQLKESYNNGSMGDAVYRAMIETHEKNGKYAEAEKIREKLRKREEERRREKEERINKGY
ncbi:hypothetical protein HP397_03255 [Streptobacillus felis]|uniref:Uncharacterized protein n=1 Tax=Streptobacillus felis TaxID=1384509 RepID=A0A7Z0PGI7_9FUSO|nr:hypothetical protein [Streptobacillus felis]NYV27840.1 hypothetical protein [Streptobacillus felis]